MTGRKIEIFQSTEREKEILKRDKLRRMTNSESNSDLKEVLEKQNFKIGGEK